MMSSIIVNGCRLFDVFSEKGDISVRAFNIKTEEEIANFKIIGLSLKDTNNGGFQNIYAGDIPEINSLGEKVLSLFGRRNFYEMTKAQRLETIKDILIAQLRHQEEGIILSMRLHQKAFPDQSKALGQKIADIQKS